MLEKLSKTHSDNDLFKKDFNIVLFLFVQTCLLIALNNVNTKVVFYKIDISVVTGKN